MRSFARFTHSVSNQGATSHSPGPICIPPFLQSDHYALRLAHAKAYL